MGEMDLRRTARRFHGNAEPSLLGAQAWLEPQLASADYPELAEILVERPPLEGVRIVGSKTAADTVVLWRGVPDYGGNVEIWDEGAPVDHQDFETAEDLLAYMQEDRTNYGQWWGSESDAKFYAGGYTGSNGDHNGVVIAARFPADLPRDGDYTGAVIPSGTVAQVERVEVWSKSGWRVLPHRSGLTITAESLQAEAGIGDWLLNKGREWADSSGTPTDHAWTYDWCRFRRNSRCYYPKKLNKKASKEAGYAVWVPEDRGVCPRNKWEEQKACPAPSEPGPKSNERNFGPDATVAWEDGGQRRTSSVPLTIRREGMPVSDFKGTDRNMSKSQVLAACKRIVKDVAQEFGYTGGLPAVEFSEYMGGGVAQYHKSSREFPDGLILLSEHWLERAKDRELGYHEFRVVAHEAVHAVIQREENSYKGFSQMITEGGAEVLSAWYWAKNAPVYDKRDAVWRDGGWTSEGQASLISSMVYVEWVEEILRRAADIVGWNPEAMIAEIKKAVAGNHNAKLEFRNASSRWDEHPLPPGVRSGHESLMAWLLSGVKHHTASTAQIRVIDRGLRMEYHPEVGATRLSGITVSIPGVREIGYLAWKDGVVDQVEVEEGFRRRGIATAMFEWAKEIEPGLQHSTKLLPDGKAWVQSFGSSSPDADMEFHFHAAWTDVRSKAKQIREASHVRIIAATNGYITAEVKGSSGVYQTTIMRAPGSKATAMWECGCNWSNYAWGRSGRWKRYEGRMCSHALALVYEAQAREMFGGTITEDRGIPEWRGTDKAIQSGQWGGHAFTSSMHSAAEWDEQWEIAPAMVAEDGS